MVLIELSVQNLLFFVMGFILGIATVLTVILAIWIIPRLKSFLSLIEFYHKVKKEEEKNEN